MKQAGMKAAIAAGVCVLLWAPQASAEWGDGVTGGPFRLHPGVTVSVGYDSNLYYNSEREAARIRQAPEARLTPSLTLETVEPGAWDISGQAQVGWTQYFSDEEIVRRQSGLSASLGASALWNGDGAVSLRFSEQFVRSNETPNSPSAQSLNRIFNRAGVMVGVHPGGRVLETYGSYDFSLYRHNRLQWLDRDTHHLGWNASWKFLPRTAIVAEVDHRRIRYREAFQGSAEVLPDSRLPNVNSNPLRLIGGLQGLLTRRITLGLRGGYGWGFYESEVPGADFRGPLAKAELSYQFGTLDFDNRLRAGYELGFRDSPIGSFYSFHRGVVGYEQGFVNNRLRVGLDADVQLRDYAPLGVSEVQTVDNVITIGDLEDLLVGANGSAVFSIRRGFDVGARYSFRSNFTEDVILVEGLGEDAIRDYQRHYVLLFTELRY